VGSVFACFLRSAGHDVTLLGRDGRMGPIRRSGLSITGIWGEHHAAGFHVAESPAEIGRDYDAVLVTCKSTQTDELIAAIGDRAAPGGIAVSLQNGLGNVERIERVYGAGRVLAGRVIFGAEPAGPGCVRVDVSAEPVLIGNAAGGMDPRAREWAAIIDAAGIECAPTADVLAALWAKVFYNAALNPLGALLGLRYGELAAQPRHRKVMDRVVEEAFAVAQAEGVALSWSSAREYLDVFYGRLVPATAAHRSSMLQDLEAGRTTEIDAICGEVCRRALRHGIETPVNDLLALLVEARSSSVSREPAA
jgi:2-dehydropantoate 2-reductase